ncbi:hypothetical protein DH2020_036562 [Rehmannia glutinosa]|uniref:Beta-adaptin-like protein n=1 Tax=Rehmannia glutinosa TaxID=99300 RepID=A0ABR0V478_REHGL
MGRLVICVHAFLDVTPVLLYLSVLLKGEVSDLKMQLRQLAGSRAPGTDDTKRELFKKVISYMTIGIDVSSVFSEMVMCSATSDIVLKKMCYLYVGNYAKHNPDLALLTINFLQRDCKDEDPMIRGLALRSLCSLGVANLVEYLVGPLGNGLKDGNSYVRMVAAVGVLKLYHLSAVTCMDADFPALLKHLMLKDKDAQVVANCLTSLQEIWSLEAGTSEEATKERESLLSKPDRLCDCNSLSNITSTGELDLLLAFPHQDRLVYIAQLHKMKEFGEWAQCIVLELVSKYVPTDSDEIFDIMNLLEDRLQHANGAVVLATIKVFLHMTLSMTDVHQQLEMLTAVANESNTYEIVTELCEYVANVDIPMERINSSCWQDCVATQKCSGTQSQGSSYLDAREYAQDMQDSPYILESLIENWDEEHSAEVRLHLLTAVIKCFLRRPPETQKALGAALASGLADFHQDVRDRALFYYRLLQYDVSVAERIVNPPKQAVSVFADTQSSEIKDRIFDEFNSLSVVYQKPSYMFTDKEHRGPFAFSEDLGNLSIGAEPDDTVVAAQRVEENDKDLLLSTSEKEESQGYANNGSAYNAPSYNASTTTGGSQGHLDLVSLDQTSTAHTTASLAIDELLGLGMPAGPSPAPLPSALLLNAKAVIDPNAFQQKWRQLPVSVSQDISIDPRGVAAMANPQALPQHMQAYSIHCIASGGQAPNFKFFFFAQKADESSTYLVECVINSSSCKVQLKIKADDQSTSQAFAELFQSALSKLSLP